MSLDMVVDNYALSFIDQIQLTFRFQKLKVNYVSNLKIRESEVLLTFGSCTLS